MPSPRSVRLSLEDLGLDLTALAMAPEDVARLTRPEREARLDALLVESEAIVRLAIDRMITNDRGPKGTGKGYAVAGVVGLFSGGNDSTVTCDLMRRLGLLTHTGHANTRVGVEATRQYVRDVSAAWGVPLIERSSTHPNDTYEALVMDKGFPGAARHAIMQNRLKDHALRLVRAALVSNPHRERVLFVAGRRRTESDQRTTVPELERIGSTVWVSPLINWTKMDMNTYRLRFGDVPRNEVADRCHMSAECLCGAYARPYERQEITAEGYGAAFDPIAALEARLAGPEGDHLPQHVKTWGWEHDPNVVKPKRIPKPRKTATTTSAALCDTCATRGPADHDHAETITT